MSNNIKKQMKRLCMLLFVTVVCIPMIYFFTKGNAAYAANQTGKVTATNLNVRSQASTSASVVAVLPQGTMVTVTSTTTNSSGTKWYKISATLNGKNVTGYVSASYISIIKSSSSSTFLKRFGYVTASSLHVRSAMSTSSASLGKLTKSQYVLVKGSTKKSGVTWYSISATINGKTVRGYVVKDYVTLYPTTVAMTTYDLHKVSSKTLPAYKTANTYDTKRATLVKNQSVIVRGKLKVRGVDWSLVYAVVDGKGMNAYVKSSSLVPVTATAEHKTNDQAVITGTTSAKRIAATIAANVATLEKGTIVTVEGTVKVDGKQWYRCSFNISNEKHTGYVRTSYVNITDDAEFLKELGQFPSSYQSALKELHKEYPNWHFKAVNTGLDWNTVIENESKHGRNTIMSNQPNGGSAGTYSAPFSFLSTEPGSYDWSKDKYTLCDGTNWFTANSQVISHYMDPRNSLTPNLIWQFESLEYDERQKESVVASILSDTFMKGSYSVVDKFTGKTVSGKYSKTFMEAGKINNISPYFLSIRSKQELGTNGSGSVSGTYPGYVGFYNYYNIGAYDSATNQAIANGLKYASSGSTYNRPWTNPYKAIVGGAQYIASSYLAKGQNTTYFQKFNVVCPPYYSYQYMTNVQAPTSESKNTFHSYSKMGIAKDAFVFYIPVYNNMPSKPCELPERKGNPNSYLKNIVVKNGSTSHPLTPTFHYQTKSYTMVVENHVSSVVVNANTVSSRATVSGTGTYSLTAGATKTISLVGKAENGDKTTYTLKIFRKAS